MERRRGQWRLLVALAINALLMPLYGPLVDRQFAHSLPYHLHLYHNLQAYQLHLREAAHDDGDEHSHGSESEVVSLPAQELASPELLLLFLFLAAVLQGMAGPLPNQLVIGAAEGSLLPAQPTYIAPPRKPPRM